MMDFPVPDDDAKMVSDRLKTLIADRIAAAGGHVPFADYMQWVLYEPALGYYSGGSHKLGEAGDFVTAPELGDVFGRTLARAIVPLLEQTDGHVLEFGAGTGRLAQTVLAALDALGVSIDRYSILDLSGELRERQSSLLGDDGRVQWRSSLPDAFSGVVLANEMLDAMPVKLVCWRDGQWMERCVSCEGDGFAFVDCPASEALLSEVRASLPAELEVALLPDGYVTEVHPHALGFIRSLAGMMCKGRSAAVLVDYGFPAHEYYLVERSEGTLMCHYRQMAHDDPFYLPGLQDVTSHVNFTSVAEVACSSGLDVLCYSSQASFLMASGVMDCLPKMCLPDAERAKLMQETMKLLSPAEMGELFKVMVLGHDVEPSDAMLQVDRSGRL